MKKTCILRHKGGFTLVELMVTMVIFVFAMAAAAGMFSGLLTQFKQQSRITESSVESIVGLELLRRDLQQAGNGIPWNMDGVNYAEAVASGTPPNHAAAYNDAPDPPRAIVFQDGLGWTSPGQLTGSDEIAIKATSVATNAASQKWTFIEKRVPSAPNIMRTWGAIGRENLDPDEDFVVVINPGSGNLQRTLVHNGGTFYTKLGDSGFSFNPPTSNTTTFVFEPYTDTQGAYVVYGIKSGDNSDPPRMPFNRADYYISANNVPSRCATSELPEAQRRTGVLLKSVIDNSTASATPGERLPGLPILDCVADMQVIAMADTAPVPLDGAIDAVWGTVPAGSTAAQQIRDQMKEVRVYILAQEGQKDPTFQFTNFTGSPAPPFNNGCPGSCATCIDVGEPSGLAACSGHIFDLSKIPDYLNYRWKVYTITVATKLR